MPAKRKYAQPSKDDREAKAKKSAEKALKTDERIQRSAYRDTPRTARTGRLKGAQK
jgi:hypothetical protein